MKRYIKLYKSYLTMAFKSNLAYKVDSIIALASFIITNAVTFLTLDLMIGNLSSFGESFAFTEVAFLYGLCLIPKGIDHLFSDDLWSVGMNWVIRGELDRYLIKPVPVLFQVVAGKFKWDGFGEIILGIIFVAIFGPQQTFQWNLTNTLFLITCEILAVFLFFSIKLLTCSLAFWMKRSISIMNLIYCFSDYTKYPLHMMGKFIEVVLFAIIPFGAVLYLPFYCLYSNYLSLGWCFLIVVGVTFLWLFISYFLWKKGLHRYESAGS